VLAIVEMRDIIVCLLASALRMVVSQCDTDSLKMVSYNTGLISFEPEMQTAARLASGGIENSVRSWDADIVCLQEVWDVSTILDLTVGLGDLYPHSASFVDGSTASESPPCAAATMGLVAACMASCTGSMCGSASGQTYYLFTSENEACANARPMLEHTDCMRCILKQGQNMATCMQTSERYDYTAGLLLLSKVPLVDITRQAFPATVPGDRGFLAAKLTHGGCNRMAVICTHLAANTTYIPYPPIDWAGLTVPDCFADPPSCANAENVLQAQALIDYTTEQPDDHVLLGDFNTGPEITAMSNGYNLLLNAGWVSATLPLGPTWSTANTFAAHYPYNETLDHIFIKKDWLRLYGGSLLKPTVRLDGGITDFSDHFGLEGCVKRAAEHKDCATETMKCGEIKQAYKDQGCCGNPSASFKVPTRRLQLADDEHQPLLDQVSVALEQARREGKLESFIKELKLSLEK